MTKRAVSFVVAVGALALLASCSKPTPTRIVEEIQGPEDLQRMTALEVAHEEYSYLAEGTDGDLPDYGAYIQCVAERSMKAWDLIGYEPERLAEHQYAECYNDLR